MKKAGLSGSVCFSLKLVRDGIRFNTHRRGFSYATNNRDFSRATKYMIGLSSPLGVPFWLFSILTGVAFGVGGYCLYKPCEYLVKKKLLRKRT